MIAAVVDPRLLKQLEAGEYVVDPSAVAEAILRRLSEASRAGAASTVLESRELEGASRAVEEGEPAPGDGLS